MSMSKTWGFVDIDRHAKLRAEGYDLRIYVDGRNVTDRCRWFDDRERRAELLLFRQGMPYLDPATGGPATEIVTEFDIRYGRG